METALIVFASSVSGNRLKNSALRANIKDVRITQTPNAIKTDGCSYSLKVKMSDLDNIMALAKRNNIRFTAIYREGRDMNGRPIYHKL